MDEGREKTLGTGKEGEAKKWQWLLQRVTQGLAVGYLWGLSRY